MNASSGCKGCGTSVRVPQREIDRLVAEIRSGADIPLSDDETYRSRLETCSACPDLLYGTTCRHCGCLVAVRAKFAGKSCPGIPAKW